MKILFDFFLNKLMDFADVDLVLCADVASVRSDLEWSDCHLVTGDVCLQVIIGFLLLLVCYLDSGFSWTY